MKNSFLIIAAVYIVCVGSYFWVVSEKKMSEQEKENINKSNQPARLPPQNDNGQRTDVDAKLGHDESALATVNDSQPAAMVDLNMKELLDAQVSNEERRKINSLLNPSDFVVNKMPMGGGMSYQHEKRYFSVPLGLVNKDGKNIIIDITSPLPMIEP